MTASGLWRQPPDQGEINYGFQHLQMDSHTRYQLVRPWWRC
jgi:hypothetical protein